LAQTVSENFKREVWARRREKQARIAAMARSPANSCLTQSTCEWIMVELDDKGKCLKKAIGLINAAKLLQSLLIQF